MIKFNSNQLNWNERTVLTHVARAFVFRDLHLKPDLKVPCVLFSYWFLFTSTIKKYIPTVFEINSSLIYLYSSVDKRDKKAKNFSEPPTLTR